MKKLIIIATITFTLFSNANAQIKFNYDTCQHLRQFEGEWKYANGQDTIKIYLRYHRFQLSQDETRFVHDALIGWHEYKHANIIVESDYNKRFATLPYNFDPFYRQFSINLNFDIIKNQCSMTSRMLHGEITDFLEANQGKEVFATVNAAGTIMTWKQQHLEWYGHGNGMVGMTLAPNFVLVKQ